MKICSTCGNEVDDSTNICIKCGCPITKNTTEKNEHIKPDIVVNRKNESTAASYISLALAILSVVFIINPLLGIVFAILSLILSRKLRKETDEGDVCANIAMIISIITLFIYGMILAIGAAVLLFIGFFFVVLL